MAWDERHVSPDWPYIAGAPVEAGNRGPRFARTGRLLVERAPTEAQCRMIATALQHGGVIPIACDRRVLKGCVARRLAIVQPDETARLTPKGIVAARRWIKKIETQRRERVYQANQRRFRAAETTEELDRLERARAEARARVFAQARHGASDASSSCSGE